MIMERTTDSLQVQELSVSDELRQVWWSNVVDLARLGVPWMPVIGKVSYRRCAMGADIWHVHSGCNEVIYCKSGVCEYESGGKTYLLKPGRVFVSRPSESHRRRGPAQKGYSALNFLLQIDKIGRNDDMKALVGELMRMPRLVVGGASLLASFNRVFWLAGSNRTLTEGRKLRLRMTAMNLVLGVADAVSVSNVGGDSVFVKAIVEEIRRHPENDYSLSSLLARTGMTSAKLIKAFKAETGMPPHAFLLNCRIEAAKAVLLKGMGISAVAKMFQFPSLQHFSSTFKRFVGVSPKIWVDEKVT